MSILVALTYTGAGESARRFAEEMEQSGTTAAIRAERGNLRYDYFFPLSDPESVLLLDAWEDQAALDAHHDSPMMKTVLALREKYGLRASAERFFPDEAGLPERDAAFLRAREDGPAEKGDEK